MRNHPFLTLTSQTLLCGIRGKYLYKINIHKTIYIGKIAIKFQILHQTNYKVKLTSKTLNWKSQRETPANSSFTILQELKQSA